MAQPFDLFFHFGIKHNPRRGFQVFWRNNDVMADTGCFSGLDFLSSPCLFITTIADRRITFYRVTADPGNP